MPVHNADIAAIFDEMADLLEIENENPFRVRAYRAAAQSIGNLGREVSGLLEQGEDLTRLPGIGKDLAAKIAEIVRTGHAAALDQLHRKTPAALAELMKIPGLGPKRVHALYHDLKIKNAAQLRKAIEQGRVRTLPGFGAKTEQRILQSLHSDVGTKERRFKLALAAQYAEPLVEYLKDFKGVGNVVVAGSFRRRKETVGDLDILVTARSGEAVAEHFVGYDEVTELVSQGGTRSTVILRNGLQVDLRVVLKASFGAALHYFTGSRAHNIAIRRMGQQRGLKINEYGVFKGDKRIAGNSEESVFAAVGLPFIEPELRENRGEIEAANAGKLPELVALDDLRGDLHAHTDATDGHDSLEDMVRAAKDLGMAYLAITDHSRHLTVANGLDPKRLSAQIDAIDRLNEKLSGITLLKGIEVDILEDGSLDLPDPVLKRLDVVVGAVHSQFGLSRDKQTRRILRAMDNRHVTLLAHPSGRLLGEREAYEVDMPRIVRGARNAGCFLKLNAHPERLDLQDVYCRLAKETGVLVSVNSDAHSTDNFDLLRFGIGQARRGWLEKDDVLNTRPLTALRKLLN
ncbi:MAG: DNA polymerase/3'-5' exonuclease PolX, partial [Gammaproteobacteria bacterium]